MAGSINHALIHSTADEVLHLIESGADVNECDSCGDTPLANVFQYLETEERHRVLEALLKAGADPNKLAVDCGPLFMACINFDPVGLKMLLDAGADPNLEVDLNESLLDYAEGDYRFEVYDHKLPEEPTDENRATFDTWLTFLDRMAITHGKRRPLEVILLRQYEQSHSQN